MKLQFLGAAQTVTGSAHLLTAGGKRLLVDFGMFQGKDAEREHELPCPAGEIDYVVSTHAHIDHTGHLPLLVCGGYHGEIFSTQATAKLAGILLADSAHIQKMDTEWENRKRLRKGLPPVEPLYTAEEAQRAAAMFHPIEYGEKLTLSPEFTIRLVDAGHILGSAIVEVWATEGNTTRKVVFSGDLGNLNQPILKDPQFVREADVLLVESTYGNRVHPEAQDVKAQLTKVICDTFARGGKVVIPAFAVGRTQELLYYLRELYHAGTFKKYERCPVFLDSPLAIEATQIFNESDSDDYYDREARAAIARGEEILEFPQLKLSVTADDSRSINAYEGSCIIISASGMCDAGRIRHHLKYTLWDERNTVLLVGFQAEGTLGRRLLGGEKQVRLLGDEVAVKAQIESIAGLSAHADHNGLLRWVKGFTQKPQKVFVIHGEPEAALDFVKTLKEELGLDAVAPQIGESADLLAQTASLIAAVAHPQVESVTLVQLIAQLQALQSSGAVLSAEQLSQLAGAVHAAMSTAKR